MPSFTAGSFETIRNNYYNTVVSPWLRRRLDAFRKRFPIAYWRGRNAVALGEWWWARRRPRDDDSDRDTYDDAFWDRHGNADWDGLATIILRYCPARSVVDVGCGQGTVLEGFRRVDPALALMGFDGSPTARKRALARGLSVDQLDVVALSNSEAGTMADRIAAFDLALCLEVAEHIPAWHSGKLLTMLAGARRLVFSAAVPNQGGQLHVNEQPARYWVDRLSALGLSLAPYDGALRAELQSLALPPWYKENIHAFERSTAFNDTDEGPAGARAGRRQDGRGLADPG
jgi:2-polyprenyl-3-methyl-5-hydroxy-6-metoxy-1,4-benzoquinol methylase